MKLKIKKLHPNAVVPKFATEGAACFDLHAIVDTGSGHTQVGGRNALKFRTGLSFEIPAGHVMMIYSRSGHGFNHDIRLANCVGVIDSDYRGEVQVKLTADSDYSLGVSNGDRIAQAMIIQLPHVQMEVVDELSETVRGTGGFGSTGQ